MFHLECLELKSFKWPSCFWPASSLQEFPWLQRLPFLPRLLTSSLHHSTSPLHHFLSFSLPLPLMAYVLSSPPHLWLTDSRPLAVMLVKPIKAGNHPPLFRCLAVCTHRAERVGRVAVKSRHTHTHSCTHHPCLSDSCREVWELKYSTVDPT